VNSRRQIKIVEVTGFTPPQITTEFNTNWGPKGWRIVQVVVISSKTYLIADKEI